MTTTAHQTTASPGDAVGYDIVVENRSTTGTTTTVRVELGDLANHASITDISGSGHLDGTAIVWDLSIGPSETATIGYTAKLDDRGWRASVTPVDSVVTAPGSNCTGADRDACRIEVTVGATANLAVHIDVATSPAGPFRSAVQTQVGGDVWYRLRIDNTGTMDVDQPRLVTTSVPALLAECPPLPGSLAAGGQFQCLVKGSASRSAVVSNVTVSAGSDVSVVRSANAVVTGLVATGPAIHLAAVAEPAVVDRGGATVEFRYLATNTGQVTLAPPQIADPGCAPAILVSGDDNRSGAFDPGETWTYTCRTAVALTRQATVVATARAASGAATDTANVRVEVLRPRVGIAIHADGSPSTVVRGGTVTLAYSISNTGAVPIDHPVVDSRACGPIRFVTGDANADGRLDPGEVWRYACTVAPGSTRSSQVVASGTTAAGPVQASTSQQVVVVEPDATISVVVTPSEAALPPTGGRVTLFYLVSATSTTGLSGVSITDDHCESIDFVGGDDDGDRILSDSEVWRYSCSTTVLETTAFHVVATGTVGPARVNAETTVTVPLGAAFPGLRVRTSVSPPSLPGSGVVSITHAVTNRGNVPLSSVRVDDTACTDMAGPLGDTNEDGVLDLDEVWAYVCNRRLTKTVTEDVSVSGAWGTVVVRDRDTTAVAVGTARGDQPRIGMDTVLTPKSLPVGGGQVVVRYLIRNKGDTPLQAVEVTDDICGQPAYLSGDQDRNALLDLGEIWLFGCTGTLTATTRNTARVQAAYQATPVAAVESLTVAVLPAPASPSASPPPPASAPASPSPSASASAPASGGPPASAAVVPSAGTSEPSNGQPSVEPGPSAPAASEVPSSSSPTIGSGSYPSTVVVGLVALAGVLAAAAIIRMTAQGRRV